MISLSSVFSIVLNFSSQRAITLFSFIFKMIKASGNIPALCIAKPWALVLGNPDSIKLFFSLETASISFLTISITI